MDFNLKSESPRKMPSYFLPPGFQRSFSTSPFMENNMPKNPFINFFSDFHTRQSTENKLYKSVSVPGMSSPFSRPGSMSVSCFVSGIVGTNSEVQPVQESSSEIYFDMCLLKNAFSTSVTENTNLTYTDSEPTVRRTYAEVTKEIPDTQVLETCSTSTSCDNSKIKNIENIKKPKENSLKLVLDNSAYPDSLKMSTNQNRSLSESSADSDDSFIVFDYTDEDGNVYESEIDPETPESQEDSATLMELCDEDSDSDSSDDNDEGDWLTPDDLVTPIETCDELDDIDCSEDRKSVDEPKRNKVKTKTKTVTFKLSVDVFFIIDDGENESRCGPWEEHARDRVRFERRIHDLHPVISKILEPLHRENIYKNRFMTT